MHSIWWCFLSRPVLQDLTCCSDEEGSVGLFLWQCNSKQKLGKQEMIENSLLSLTWAAYDAKLAPVESPSSLSTKVVIFNCYRNKSKLAICAWKNCTKIFETIKQVSFPWDKYIGALLISKQ